MRIARMSRRVFLLSAKLGAHVQKVISQLKELLSEIDSSSVASLVRKLDRIVEDFLLSERIVHQLMHGSGKRGRFDSSCNTPLDSPISSPRCSSPVTTNDNSEIGTASSSERSIPVPCAPPNTPIHRPKRRLKRSIPRRSFRDSNHATTPPPTSANSPENNSSDFLKENVPIKNIPTDFSHKTAQKNSQLGSSSPPTRKKSNLPRRKTIEGDNLSVRGKSNSPSMRRKTVDGSPIAYSRETSPLMSPASSQQRLLNSIHPQQTSSSIAPPSNVPQISITDTSEEPVPEESSSSSQSRNVNRFDTLLLSDVDENCRELREEEEEVEGDDEDEDNNPNTVKHVTTPTSSPQKPTVANDTMSIVPSPEVSLPFGNNCCECNCHRAPGGISPRMTDDLASVRSRSSKSGTAGVPNTPESPEKAHYHTSEHESMSSDDFLDFSQEGCTAQRNEKPVSFKSEVAESPKSSPNHSVHSGELSIPLPSQSCC